MRTIIQEADGRVGIGIDPKDTTALLTLENGGRNGLDLMGSRIRNVPAAAASDEPVNLADMQTAITNANIGAYTKPYNYGTKVFQAAVAAQYSIGVGLLDDAAAIIAKVGVAKDGDPADNDTFSIDQDNTAGDFATLKNDTVNPATDIYKILSVSEGTLAYVGQSSPEYYISVLSCDGKQRGIELTLAETGSLISKTDTMVTVNVDATAGLAKMKFEVLGDTYISSGGVSGGKLVIQGVANTDTFNAGNFTLRTSDSTQLDLNSINLNLALESSSMSLSYIMSRMAGHNNASADFSYTLVGNGSDTLTAPDQPGTTTDYVSMPGYVAGNNTPVNGTLADVIANLQISGVVVGGNPDGNETLAPVSAAWADLYNKSSGDQRVNMAYGDILPASAEIAGLEQLITDSSQQYCMSTLCLCGWNNGWRWSNNMISFPSA